MDPLSVASEIADHLCRECHTHRDQCTWLGTIQQGAPGTGALRFSYETVGPTLYAGTAGIALFLAEVSVRTRDRRQARIAGAAIRHAMSHADEVPHDTRYGFYSGKIGIAHTAARLACLLGRADLLSEARRLLNQVKRSRRSGAMLDVIAGAAGAIAPLLQLARVLDDQELGRLAHHLGLAIMRRAQKRSYGWSWGSDATGFATGKNLTGFAHGAAGFGWSLFELYHQTRDRRFLGAARNAFRYENHWFRKDEDNWPDFRDLGVQSSTQVPCRMAWCHGAPGIGLSRLAALSIRPSQRYRTDVEASLRSTIRAIEMTDPKSENDSSPCHGSAGLAEFAIMASEGFSDHRALDLTLELAASRAERYAGATAKWPCGVVRGTNPSLMLGHAGIGYFYLRLYDRLVPSILLPASAMSRVTAAAVPAPSETRQPTSEG